MNLHLSTGILVQFSFIQISIQVRTFCKFIKVFPIWCCVSFTNMPAFYSKYTVRCILLYYILLALSFKRCCSSTFQFFAAWIWTKMLYHLPWAINSAQKSEGRNTKSFFGYKQKQRLTWHRWVGINTRWRSKMAGPLKKITFQWILGFSTNRNQLRWTLCLGRIQLDFITYM